MRYATVNVETVRAAAIRLSQVVRSFVRVNHRRHRFDFINYITGQLDPAQATIARKACISLRSATRGLANLEAAGVLHWIRRATETRDERGRWRFCEEQDTNAYGVLPVSQWRGFIDIREAVRARINSFSNSARPPSTVSINRPHARSGSQHLQLSTTSSPDPRYGSSEPKLLQSGKMASQPHDAPRALALNACSLELP
jgi:hypothetical protein